MAVCFLEKLLLYNVHLVLLASGIIYLYDTKNDQKEMKINLRKRHKITIQDHKKKTENY